MKEIPSSNELSKNPPYQKIRETWKVATQLNDVGKLPFFLRLFEGRISVEEYIAFYLTFCYLVNNFWIYFLFTVLEYILEY